MDRLRNRNNLPARNALNNTNFRYSQEVNNNIIYNNDINPFNNFTPSTTVNGINDSNNYDAAFVSPVPLIQNMNTFNQGNVLHNNLKNNLLEENITEYIINIDSLDRDVNVYPNPYNFAVTFNPNSSSVRQVRRYENGKMVYDEVKFGGAAQPFINKEFRNVKYIKINDVILPQYGNIVFNEEANKYVLDKNCKLIDDRFIMISIDELSSYNSRIYNTSESSDRINYETGQSLKVPSPFCSVYPDAKYGKYFYYADIMGGGIQVFKNNRLGNISKLTFCLHDSYGVPLSVNCLGEGKFSSCDLRNPMHKYHQVFISITIGVVENDLSTNVKYEK